MSKQRMGRSLPEYKEKMARIRKVVQLDKRSDTFRKIRAELKPKHRDTLEINFAYFVEIHNGDSSLAEKKAIQEVFKSLFQRIKIRQKDDREFYRAVTIVTGISRDFLKSMTAEEIISAVEATEVFR